MFFLILLCFVLNTWDGWGVWGSDILVVLEWKMSRGFYYWFGDDLVALFDVFEGVEKFLYYFFSSISLNNYWYLSSETSDSPWCYKFVDKWDKLNKNGAPTALKELFVWLLVDNSFVDHIIWIAFSNQDKCVEKLTFCFLLTILFKSFFSDNSVFLLSKFRRVESALYKKISRKFSRVEHSLSKVESSLLVKNWLMDLTLEYDSLN